MTFSLDHPSTDPLAPRLWIHPSARRYYRARLFQNLFGHWEMEQAWGSLTTRHGRLIYVPIACLADGHRQMAAVAKRRAQRGYVPQPSSEHQRNIQMSI